MIFDILLPDRFAGDALSRLQLQLDSLPLIGRHTGIDVRPETGGVRASGSNPGCQKAEQIPKPSPLIYGLGGKRFIGHHLQMEAAKRLVAVGITLTAIPMFRGLDEPVEHPASTRVGENTLFTVLLRVRPDPRPSVAIRYLVD